MASLLRDALYMSFGCYPMSVGPRTCWLCFVASFDSDQESNVLSESD